MHGYAELGVMNPDCTELVLLLRTWLRRPSTPACELSPLRFEGRKSPLSNADVKALCQTLREHCGQEFQSLLAPDHGLERPWG